MSVDERLRSGLREAAAVPRVDTDSALVEVENMDTKVKTRHGVLLAVAAAAVVVAGLVWGPGIIGSVSGQGEMAPAGQPLGDRAVVNAACEPAPPAEINYLVGAEQLNWAGSGELAVTSAQVATVDEVIGSIGFKRVTYLLADVDGQDPQVFTFVATSPTPWVTGLGGTLIGADPATRAAFVWGQDTREGGTLDEEAKAAVEAAGACF